LERGGCMWRAKNLVCDRLFSSFRKTDLRRAVSEFRWDRSPRHGSDFNRVNEICFEY
jgi:hypothetical protein